MSKFNNNYVFTDDIVDYIETIYKGKSTFEITDLINKKFDKDIKREQVRNYLKDHKMPTGFRNKWINQEIKYEKVIYKGNTKQTSILNEFGKYESKQKYIYRRHYGSIPKGCVIVFLDNNRENFDINNLMAVPKKIIPVMNFNHLFFDDKELNKTSFVLAELMIKKMEKIRNEKV